MKKMLLILAVGMLSLQSFAKENVNARACTAHYTLVIMEDGEPSRHIHVQVTASNCANAVDAARGFAYARYMDQL